MNKFTTFLKAQKVGILIGVIICLIVAAIVVLAVTSNPKTLDSKPTNESETQTNSLTAAIETNDFNILKQSLGSEVSLVEIKTDECCTVNEEDDVLSKVIEFLQLTNTVKSTPASKTDAQQLMADSEYDFTKFSYFSSADGKAWMAVELDDQSKVKLIILRYPVGPVTEVVVTEEETEEQPVQSSSQAASTPNIDIWGVVQASVKKGAKFDAQLSFVDRDQVLTGTKCTFTRNSTFTDGTIETASNEVTLQSQFTPQSFNVYAGVHNYRLDCLINGAPYTKTGTVTLIEIPLTACDTKPFEFGENVATMEELQTKMVGKWRGCAYTVTFGDGSFSYGVELTINSDGSYSARNYDSEMNNGNLPANWPLHPAFYYGTDDDLPSKRVEIDTFNQTNGAVGAITIAYNANNSAIDTLRNFKVSTDGQKLTFGYIHNGQYGPIVYKLEKVAE